MPAFFKALPGAIYALATHHIMTFLLVGTIGISASWIVLIITYQNHVRRAADRAARDRKLPGSFPGDRN